MFETYASNLVVGDTNSNTDIFVHAVLDGTTVRVSVSSVGGEAAFGANTSAISANGRFVVFSSADAALVFGDANSGVDVFLRDRGTI